MRVAMISLALAACGDSLTRDTVLEPTSGTRLKLEWYLFEDGTQQVEPRSFYDTEMHARCEPRTFVDGTTRCLPFADEALYIDATCENVVGRVTTPADIEPTHFIGYDRVAGALLPARVYAATQPREPVTELYERIDGTCEGPFATATDLTYYDLGVAYDVLALHEGTVEGEQIAARLQLTDDGLRLPFELQDRARQAPCRPELRTDGSVVCAPTTAVLATLFADASCTTAVVAVDPSSPPPEAAARLGPSGCTTYHAVGAPYEGPRYEMRGERCTRLAADELLAFEVDAALDLPLLERTVEDEPRRRLQRITLTDGDFIVVDDRLYDSAIRTECRREVIAHNARCLPATTMPVLSRFQPGCTLELQIAEVPRHTCAPVTFATATTELGSELHAIGAPLAAPVFELADAQCRPYAARADHVLHALGPALGPDAFARGVRYGER
jgi:hypothetical protein